MIRVNLERRRGKPIEIGFDIPLENMRLAIMEEGKRAMLPIEVKIDEVKIGSGFSVKANPCIIIYNTQHRRDYYNIVLVLEKHYNTYIFSSYLGGNSSNYANSVMLQGGGAVMNYMKRSAQRKLEEEHIFYDLLDKVIGNAFKIAVTMPNQQEKTYNTPPSQTQTSSSQSEPQQTKIQSASTQKQPVNKSAVSPDVNSETKRDSKSVLNIMWFIWIILSIICIVAGGIEAILTDILGFVLLYWAQKLIQKGHIGWAILPIFIGGFCLSFGIMIFSSTVGVILFLICSLIFYFSCWE